MIRPKECRIAAVFTAAAYVYEDILDCGMHFRAIRNGVFRDLYMYQVSISVKRMSRTPEKLSDENSALGYGQTEALTAWSFVNGDKQL